ncbi:MAG: T9SS type A sorting domain-containing protein [Bacteroidota bacterium]
MKNIFFTYLLLLGLPVFLLAQWTANPIINTEIVDTTGMQVQPKIVVNDNGESYISWFSNFEANQFNVYMQRLDVNGNSLWGEAGLLISNHPTASYTTDYDLIIDNTGCAILVTQDYRTGNSNVFAYRISPDGNFLWGENGIAITNDTDENPSPYAIVDQDGNIIFGYEVLPADSSLNLKICLQKFSPDGQSLWDNNTIISNDTTDCFQPHFISAVDNSTIVVWVEKVSGGNKMYPFAQKIDSGGDLVWANSVSIDTLNGLPLAIFNPSLINDEYGGFFMGWRAYPQNMTTHSCFAQHINTDGIAQWTPNGVLASDSVGFKHYAPSITYLPEHNEFFLFWSEQIDYDATNNHIAIFGQKFSDTGERLWTNHGKIFDGWYPYYDTNTFVEAIMPASIDNFTVFFSRSNWTAIRDSIPVLKLHAMQINHDGDFVWENEKLVISSATSKKGFLDISDLAQNQWIITWEDNRKDPSYGTETGIYAQNISIDGQLGILTGIDEISSFTANSIINYPNPFKNQTIIEYELTQSGNVSLKLTDMNGRLVKHLFSGQLQKGLHFYKLNASGLSPGMYFVVFEHFGLISYHKIIFNI